VGSVSGSNTYSSAQQETEAAIYGSPITRLPSNVKPKGDLAHGTGIFLDWRLSLFRYHVNFPASQTSLARGFQSCSEEARQELTLLCGSSAEITEGFGRNLEVVFVIGGKLAAALPKVIDGTCSRCVELVWLNAIPQQSGTG
jgi:hypothetical protein